MYLIDFIKNNPNWRKILSMPPYSLKIKNEDDYTLFMYSQIESDFYNPIVKECRGIILDTSKPEPRVVCRAFDKFGNYGEGYVDKIDWSTARVQEKVDGSIVKVWFDKKWHISSNSAIDANKAVLNGSGMSIYKLFLKVWDITWFKSLDKNYTYIFELISPFNRVVVKYDNIDLYFLGMRHNALGMEIKPPINVLPQLKRPQEFPINSLEGCIKAAAALNAGEGEVEHEGFVVVDDNWHRIKIKSPLYVAKHHLVTKVPSLLDLVRIYKNNEKEEFLTYFSAYADRYEQIEKFFTELTTVLNRYEQKWIANPDKKSFAIENHEHPFFGWFTEAIKYNDWSIERVKNLPSERLASLLKKFLEREN